MPDAVKATHRDAAENLRLKKKGELWECRGVIALCLRDGIPWAHGTVVASFNQRDVGKVFVMGNCPHCKKIA